MIPKDEYPLEKVYEPLFPVIYKVAYRMLGSAELAEEICQEAFLRYFQLARPMADIAQARYWLIRVSKNLALNLAKRRWREARAYGRAGRVDAERETSVEAEFERQESRSAVQEALGRLPPGLRAVLVLKEYSGLNYREIGSIMKISEGNVKVRVFRARERLARELGLQEPRNTRQEPAGDTDVP